MKPALKAMLQDLYTLHEGTAPGNCSNFHAQARLILTSTGSCSLAPSLRDVNGNVPLCSSNLIPCLFGEHSRKGENSRHATVTARTAKTTMGHFRLVG